MSSAAIFMLSPQRKGKEEKKKLEGNPSLSRANIVTILPVLKLNTQNVHENQLDTSWKRCNYQE